MRTLSVVGPRTLRSELEAKVRRHPNRTWIIFEAADGSVVQVTFGDFERRARQAAHVLTDLGVRPGDKVTLHLTNSLEFLELWFGAAMCGAVIVPVNTLSSLDELEYLVNHSESVAFVTEGTEPPLLEVAEQLLPRCPNVRNLLVCRTMTDLGRARSYNRLREAAPDQPVPHQPRPEDEVAILYTSGTTSKPKGCLITNANYIHVGECVARELRAAPDDRWLTVLPFFHGNSQYYCTMPALLVGGSIAIVERFSASRYFMQATRYDCTLGSLFAAPMRMLLGQPHSPTHRQHRLRLVIFAQNVTEAQLAEWDQRFGAPLLQIYGMTEQLGHPLANPLDYPRDNMSVGLPGLGWQVRLVDEHGHDVPDGEVGQILVRGEPGVSLMKGYFKNPEATAEAIRDGWLWTGDNARVGENGYVYFVDRAKDMIKRSGENVAASEVEAVLKAHPAVFDAAVVGVPDPIRDEAIKAFVIPRPGLAITEEHLIGWCAERLAKFRVPQFVEFRTEFPRTSVGKIQKHLLRAEAQASPPDAATSAR
ncbi:MAG: AMP-binding protein [Chloroflexi bacterium]|nr:AMP-binding protein [Chloroflexota bacterium]